MYKVTFTLFRTRERVQQIKSVRMLGGRAVGLKDAKDLCDKIWPYAPLAKKFDLQLIKPETYTHTYFTDEADWISFLAYYMDGQCKGTLRVDNVEKT